MERVVEEAPGVVSVEIGGARLERLRARAGPVLQLALPHARPLVGGAPVLALGRARRPPAADHGQGRSATTPRALRAIPPGTRVIAEGPFGAFTAAARRRPRVALIAGGVGITPIRALLEDMPGEPGDIAVVYRALERRRRDPARRARRARRPARRRAALRARRPRGRRRAARAEHLQRADARHRGARRLRLRAAGDDRGDAREPRAAPACRARHIVTERFAF